MLCNDKMEQKTQPHSVMKIQKMENGRPLRQIKSFILRQGRLTKGQEEAIQSYWAQYGIDFKEDQADFKSIYHNNNEIVLEIGFGMGKSLVEMAKTQPHLNFLGIEVHKPGVGACLKDLVESQVTNLRLMSYDAVEVLETMIPDASLNRCQIFFPDPWHKIKHHKRRLIQPEFVQLLVKKLKIGGVIHLATDWQNYAEQMVQVLKENTNLKNKAIHSDFIERPNYRPLTKFENRGLKLGHGVWDLEFEKIS